MKKIILFLAIIPWILTSCLEDKGNDVYVELNDVTISGLPFETTVEQFSRLQMTPEITTSTGVFNPDNYEYLWHMYLPYASPSATTSDTLSFEKDLDVEISSIPGYYALVFEVTDKETGICYISSSDAYLEVINTYSKGMLALSEVNEEANVTFINVVGSVVEDAYQKVNGEVAGKNPTGIRYISGMLSSAEKMVVIMTDDEKGGIVVKPLDMSYVMDFKDMFWFTPAVVKPQSFGTSNYAFFEYVNNNGIIYRRENQESGYPKYGIAVGGEYDKIAPFDFYAAVSTPQVAWFYDQGRERFVYMNCPLQGDEVITLADVSGEFNPNNVGMQMLWGGLFGSEFAMNNGRCVMVDDAGERYALSFTGGSNGDVPVITPGKKIHLTGEGAREAHTFTTAQNANFLYYAYDNKIAWVSFATGNLYGPYEVEGGNVDYIECDQIGDVNQMWVGISDGSGAEDSGSIVVLEMSTDGSLKEVARYSNVCGKVVDFEYKNE